MIKKHFNTDFSKHIITLVKGTGIAQAITFLSALLLSPFYEPEDFTVFALFFLTASISYVVASARHEIAILLPKEEHEAKSILSFSLKYDL